jgi:transcriptional regulator with XRE-family HTH domain
MPATERHQRKQQDPLEAASDFGARLRRARSDRGQTLRDVSLASGISIAYLSDLERGVLVNPTLDTLRAVGKALGVSLNELLGVEDEAPSRPTYRAALEEFRRHPHFRGALEEDAKRGRSTPEELEDEWLRCLSEIRVGGKAPKAASDYLFIFEAIRRALS